MTSETRKGATARETFLVEHYRPGSTPAQLGAIADSVREAARDMERQGEEVRYLRAAVVPTDESLLCVFEAVSQDLVDEAYARAGISFERITVVIPDKTWAQGLQSRETKEER